MTKAGWICTQIGARENYAIPRVLHSCRRLQRLYTEMWSGPILTRLCSSFPGLRRFAGRFHPDLKAAPVRAFNTRFCWERLRRRQPRNREEQFQAYVRLGSQFARLVADDLSQQPESSQAEVFFSYTTSCLEVLPPLRNQGVLTIVGQIDPGRVEEDMVQQECEKWPGWQRLPGRIPDFYYERLAAEWRAADRVLVNSPWAREALVEQGVPSSKIVVVPLAYELAGAGLPRRFSEQRPNQPLRVLWLGTVQVRKGIQYLIKAARLLSDRNIRFLVVGPIEISRMALASAPTGMEFHGPVARDQAPAFYRQADLFVLPTLSDGFAITQLEAMAHGLPVIATPNCGEVVTDGVDGRIVPAANAEALAAAIAEFDQDRELLAERSEQALVKSRQFTMARLGDGLDAVARELSAARGPLQGGLAKALLP
jgi:Glycosyl transferases group 1